MKTKDLKVGEHYLVVPAGRYWREGCHVVVRDTALVYDNTLRYPLIAPRRGNEVRPGRGRMLVDVIHSDHYADSVGGRRAEPYAARPQEFKMLWAEYEREVAEAKAKRSEAEAARAIVQAERQRADAARRLELTAAELERHDVERHNRETFNSYAPVLDELGIEYRPPRGRWAMVDVNDLARLIALADGDIVAALLRVV